LNLGRIQIKNLSNTQELSARAGVQAISDPMPLPNLDDLPPCEEDEAEQEIDLPDPPTEYQIQDEVITNQPVGFSLGTLGRLYANSGSGNIFGSKSDVDLHNTFKPPNETPGNATNSEPILLEMKKSRMNLDEGDSEPENIPSAQRETALEIEPRPTKTKVRFEPPPPPPRSSNLEPEIELKKKPKVPERQQAYDEFEPRPTKTVVQIEPPPGSSNLESVFELKKKPKVPERQQAYDEIELDATFKDSE
jgi:hypothetical protein